VVVGKGQALQRVPLVAVVVVVIVVETFCHRVVVVVMVIICTWSLLARFLLLG